MNNSLTRQARFCQDRFIKNEFEGVMARFDRLAVHLQCSADQARRAWIELGLGQVHATTEAASDHWVADPAGRSLITLPICRNRLSDPEVEVIELLAFDLSYPKRIYKKTESPIILGRTALANARNRSDDLVLYETPLDYLRGWARFWSEQDRILSQSPAGVDTQMDPDRGLYSSRFPGVCLVGFTGTLLDMFRTVGDISIEDETFARRISAQLQAEIDAEISKRKYPRILLKQQEAAA